MRFFIYTILIFLLIPQRLHAQDEIIQLYDGPAPGSESWDWDEQEYVFEAFNLRMVYNVSHPTLTVFRPDAQLANGTAVIVCPGGGFQFLSIENEGYDVAKWLNSRGITAFVLKYRLAHSLTNNPMQEFMVKQASGRIAEEETRAVVALSIADGKKAISHIRENAVKYKIDPDRIGIMGFSAGGTVTTAVAYTYLAADRPDFVAPVYPYVGSFDVPSVPEDAPPMFIVAATDDMFGLQDHCIDLYKDWEESGKSVELHIYARGDHGFGMTRKDLPVDTWIERFADWLEMLGYL